jgi:8-oxo-dGTP pyrophosphatase MutT (NUDIX family)
MNKISVTQNNKPALYTDHKACKFPVSIKGIIYYNNQYLLRKNERTEWELIGGKLELNEDPISCLVREIKEETSILVNTKNIIDAWIYCLSEDVSVLILTYGCKIEQMTLPIVSPENATLAWFTYKDIQNLNMPNGYKDSIKKYQDEFLTNLVNNLI